MRSIGLSVGNLDETAFRNVSLALAKGFLDAGLSVDVAYLKGDPPTYRAALDPRASLVKLRADRSLLSARAVAAYLRERAPDALVTISALQNLPGVLGARLARYRGALVLTEHAHMSHESAVEHGDKWLFRNLPRAARRLYPRADGLVAVDRGVLADLTDVVRVDLSRVEHAVIPNPIDLDRVREGAVAAEPRAPDGPPVVVTVGRLSPQKNQRLLLDAFARLAPGPRLELVGDGPERRALEEHAARLGIASAVAFRGHEPNPHARTAAADVFVLPSLVEGWPLALMEAMACGCAAVATDCAPGPRTLLEDGRCGLLVPPGDPAALAAAIEELLGDPARRSDLARRGRERVAAFGIPEVTRQWLGFLDRVRAAPRR